MRELLAGSGKLAQGGSPLRILVVRPDRLGDVILSTPVFQVIKRHYSRSHLTVLLRGNHAPVIEGLPSVDNVMVFDPDGIHAGLKGFFRLVKEIRKRQFRIAVILQSHWKISAAVFFAQVRYRVGPLSKFHSFLFFNRGIRQRRSQVEMHETDYNLQLLRRLGIRVGTRSVPVQVALSDKAKAEAKSWLEEKGWKPSIPMVVVHPGMGGSALNWPESHYVELIRTFLRDGTQVLITGGPSDVALTMRIHEALGNLKDRVLVFAEPQGRPVDFLAGLYSFGQVLVAPSTGPLHLGIALGKPVVTFYSPIRVQSALRWGPYLKEEAKASVLVPEVYCGQEFTCLGNLCNYYPCMKTLTVTQAIEEIQRHLAEFARG